MENDQAAREIVAQVKKCPLYWAICSSPFVILVAQLVIGHREGAGESASTSSVALLFLAFTLVSVADMLTMPWVVLSLVARSRYTLPLSQEDIRSYANLYGLAMVGGVTPCILGCVLYIITGNPLLSLFFYLLGFAYLLYCHLHMYGVVSWFLGKLPEQPVY